MGEAESAPRLRNYEPFLGLLIVAHNEESSIGAKVKNCLELAKDGKITPLVHAKFPLADAREAMAMMERREHFGKIVLEP